ncbi:MAG TPA: peptidoglycan -binding protein [Gammaproteobacteria bacterium]|nr:peptidoglycan -binding protein [Gammaproteobacteria bacterium]
MSSFSRRSRRSVDIWPGFVDALASLLMVFVFVFLIFMLSQYFLTNTLAGRNEALADLSVRINELAKTLSLERKKTARLQEEIAGLTASLETTEEERDAARGRAQRLAEQLAGAREDLAEQGEEVARLEARRSALTEQMRGLQQDLESQRQATARARQRAEEAEDLAARRKDRMREMGRDLVEKDQALAEQRRLTEAERDQVGRLNQQITALRQQIQRLNSALEASEAKVSEQKIRIEDLGQRLNLALARKVEELKRYRSEFFGRLREVLGDNPDIRIVGDRFLFQSELLFATGSAEVGPNGRQRLRSLAGTLKEVSAEIPKDLDWILRVDGHTDRRPINTEAFPSNWELSTARALSIVRFLIDAGIPPDRLAAAGFGPHQPLDPRRTPEAYAKNRRIEIKLTRP